MSFDLDLTDRRALVTGGTKGVDAAVVEVLRDAGAKVITAARVGRSSSYFRDGRRVREVELAHGHDRAAR
jgi:NAD(P)-dependent dehydrogenase (short-subunit alcohol dehydrogenase family)